jgi:hypothetical protein
VYVSRISDVLIFTVDNKNTPNMYGICSIVCTLLWIATYKPTTLSAEFVLCFSFLLNVIVLCAMCKKKKKKQVMDDHESRVQDKQA